MSIGQSKETIGRRYLLNHVGNLGFGSAACAFVLSFFTGYGMFQVIPVAAALLVVSGVVRYKGTRSLRMLSDGFIGLPIILILLLVLLADPIREIVRWILNDPYWSL